MASVEVELGVTPENTFSIAGKQIKFDSHSDIEPYLKELESQPKVLKIDFSGNTIGIEASKSLSESLLKHKDTIVEINFSDLYTGRLNTEIPQSLNYLLPSLLTLPNLKLINLCDNAFGLQTIDPIEEYLSKAVTLEHIILSNNGMGPFAGERIGKSLYKLSKSKQQKGYESLKTFICGRNRLENGSINYLAIGLRNHKDLETIKLYQNGIRPSGIAKLINKGLQFNKNLKIIDLQDNTLTLEGSNALSKNINNWDQLIELNLNDCLLKSKGSLNVIESLLNDSPKKNLSILKLQYNELENDSLVKLVELIEKKLPNLKLLELNGNRFEEDAKSVETINEIFTSRGFGELDELDDLEEIDSDEEDEDEDDEDEENQDEKEDEDLDTLEKELGEIDLKDDSSVDDIADGLANAHIK